MTGYMSLEGWSNYTCREKLHNTIWEELMSPPELEEDDCITYVGKGFMMWRRWLLYLAQGLTMHLSVTRMVRLLKKWRA